MRPIRILSQGATYYQVKCIRKEKHYVCDYDSTEDISTIENGGCVSTSYTRDGGAEEDMEAAKNNLESHGYHQDLASRWYKD